MSDTDFRLPKVPGADTLPEWRKNPAYGELGLSPDSIALLDQSSIEEAAMAARLRERTARNRQMYEGANAAILTTRIEQHRVDQLSIGELREELSDRIDDVNLAQRKLADAEVTLQRANTSLAEAQARVSQYADLGKRITQFHVNQIRNDTGEALPPDLVEARREQRDAQDTLTATQTAFVDLAAEAQVAQSNFEQASAERDKAAVAIVSRYCDGLAEQIDHALTRLHDLRAQLLSASSVWIPLAGVATSLPVSDKVRAALRRGEERPLVSEDMKSQARAYFIKLQSDPRATMD